MATDGATKEITVTQNKRFINSQQITINEATKEIFPQTSNLLSCFLTPDTG